MQIRGSLYYNGQKKFFGEGKTLIADSLEAEISCKRYSCGAVYALLKLRNLGETPTKQITFPKTVDMFFENSGDVVYHSLMGDDNWENAFMPFDKVLAGGYRAEPAHGCSSDRTAFPFFDITFSGRTLVCGIGWSGTWKQDILITDGGFDLRVGLSPDCNFYIEPGEELRLPSVLLFEGNDPTSARQGFKKLLRDEFSPKKRLGDNFQMPVACEIYGRCVNSLNRGLNWTKEFFTTKGQLDIIEASAGFGANTYWLDASWMDGYFAKGVGTYRCAEGYPDGLKPLGDAAHNKGMKFLMWFEHERVCEGSDLYSKTEWLLASDSKSRKDRMLNLGNPDALEWVENTVIDIIRENGVDIYRQDFNTDADEFWKAGDKPNRRGITEIKHITGLYHYWDKLLETFPNLWIDCTAGGGRRIDLETVSRAAFPWRSDTNCFYQFHYPHDLRRRTSWNHNQILGISEYIPYHGGCSWVPTAYDCRSTATHGLACGFDVFNPDFDWQSAKNVIDEVYEMREFWDGDFYPLTKAVLGEKDWAAYQLSLGEKGAVYAFRPEQCETETVTLALAGIDKNADYLLTFIDESFCRTEKTCSGEELLSGIRLTINDTRKSLIMKYKKL